MEYLENQSRRNNIRIDGILEEPDETQEDSESKAEAALEFKLNLPFKVEIERAHRTGKLIGVLTTTLHLRVLVQLFVAW